MLTKSRGLRRRGRVPVVVTAIALVSAIAVLTFVRSSYDSVQPQQSDHVISTKSTETESADGTGNAQEVHATGRVKSPVLSSLGGVSEQIAELAVSPDGSVFGSASTNGMVHVWNAGGEALLSVDAHNGLAATTVEFSPDGASLISGGGDSELRKWSLLTGSQAGRPLQGHEHPITSISVSPDGELIASSGKETRIFLWEAASGKPIAVLNGHRHIVNDLSFSPDGKLLASADASGRIMLWQAAGRNVEQILLGHVSGVNKLEFSQDGRYLASGAADGQLIIWDVAGGAVHKILDGGAGGIISIAISHDSSIVAAAAMDKTVTVWGLHTGNELNNYTEPSGFVSAMTFSPDGSLVTGGIGRDVLQRDPLSGAETSRWSLN